MAEWFRNESWDDKIEALFEAKLKRSRDKPQYLKIQAIHLSKHIEFLGVSEKLLNRYFIDFPEDRFNRSSCFEILGDIYWSKDNLEKAIYYYKQAVDFEAIYPKVLTQAYLKLSELVVKTASADMYTMIENLILVRVERTLFPVEKYKGYSILSIINSYKNEIEKSRYYADLAEQNANEKTSGLRYHKELGVVKERDNLLDMLVRKI